MAKNNQVGRRTAPEMSDAERERSIVGQGGKASNEGGNTKQIAVEPEPTDRRGGQASGGGNRGGVNRSDAEESGSGRSSSAQTGRKSGRGGDPKR